MNRSARCFLAAAALATAAIGMSFSPASAQSIPDLPVPALPAPPAEVKPVLGAVSPAVFQACQSEATVLGALQLASVVGGLPVNPGQLLGPVRDASPLGLLCGYIRLSVVPPTCSADNQIPAVPVTVPRPASTIGWQVKALEKGLNQLGAPVGNQLSGPVYDQLGCR
jgi:hypothetical protein